MSDKLIFGLNTLARTKETIEFDQWLEKEIQKTLTIAGRSTKKR